MGIGISIYWVTKQKKKILLLSTPDRAKLILLIIIPGIQPLGRFGRNQSPVRRPVWLWYT